MMQPLYEQLTAELQQRAALLPREVANWNTLTTTNSEGMGIHKSQIAAISLMFEEFLARQTQLLAGLNPALAAPEFAQKRQAVEQELTGAHGIMAVFRYILAQRQDRQYYGEVLDYADLIAARCYQSCIIRARNWGVLTAEQFREPPLTYLNAMFSPMAITRRHSFGAFKLPIDDAYVEHPLPISVISLPIHHTEAIWTFCSIYHEVGHPLDQDLGLRQAFRQPLQQRLVAGGAPAERVRNWGERWLRELIADAFGILLGGDAYAHAMTHILLLPVAEVTQINPEDVHPNHYVRMFLLGALLRTTQIPILVETAQAVEQLWRQIYGEPAALAPYLDDCSTVAQVLLRERLGTLKNHCLQELAPTLANEQQSVGTLAAYLASGQNQPDPVEYAIRLVPAAAQLAVQGVTEDYRAASAAIHQRALQFMQLIPRPEELGPSEFTPIREAYLRSLVQALDFGMSIEST